MERVSSKGDFKALIESIEGPAAASRVEALPEQAAQCDRMELNSAPSTHTADHTEKADAHELEGMRIPHDPVAARRFIERLFLASAR